MIINGSDKVIKERISVSELLQELNLNHMDVVVEVNLNIVARESFKSFILENSDSVEIVGFVGGG